MHMKALRDQHGTILTHNEISEKEENDHREGDEDDDRVDSLLGSEAFSVTCQAPVTLGRRKPW